jgi:truncated hemoglobin YjbI
VPFDEAAQSAIREFVLSRYYLQVEQDARLAQVHQQAFLEARAQTLLDCRTRRSILAK